MELHIPLVELHVHLNGTIDGTKLSRRAELEGRQRPAFVRPDGSYECDGFASFIDIMSIVGRFLRTPDEYRQQTLEYLLDCSAQGAIYVELSVAPTVALRDHQISLAALVESVAKGIEAATAATGIEARIIVLPLRHDGAEEAERIAKEAASIRHPLCTGFGLAGDEVRFPAGDFTRAFDIAHDAGLGCTIHAGEARGAESIAAALELPISRIGHGVRALEDQRLVDEIRRREMVLEVCPSSNIVLGFYESGTDHPLPRLVKEGLLCTLNSDDPAIFGRSLSDEYALARDKMGIDAPAIRQMSINAVRGAFVDEATRKRLLSNFD